MSRPISIRLDDELHKLLSEYAMRLEVSPSIAVRYLIRAGIGDDDVYASGFREGFTAGLAEFKRRLNMIARETNE